MPRTANKRFFIRNGEIYCVHDAIQFVKDYLTSLRTCESCSTILKQTEKRLLAEFVPIVNKIEYDISHICRICTCRKQN